MPNRTRIQKSAFKNQRKRTPYTIARGYHKKTIKVIKVYRVKCAPAIAVVKGILIAQNNICLLVRHGNYH